VSYALTESNPAIRGVTELVAHHKANGHGADGEEAADVEELYKAVTVEDKV